MKTANTNIKSNRKKLFLGALVLVVLLGLAGTVAYRHQQNNQAIAKERAQYAQAEKDLDALSNQITAKLGSPADNSKLKGCGYTSNTNEFADHGDLFCSYDIQNIYPVESRELAASLSEDVQQLLEASNTATNTNKSTALAGTGTPEKLSTIYFLDVGGLKCTASSVFYVASDDLAASGYESLDLSGASQGLLVELNCGSRPALAAHYPLVVN